MSSEELRAPFLRQIVDACPEGIWAADAAGTTTFVNRRMAELLGGTVEGLLGTPVTRFAHESWVGAAPRPGAEVKLRRCDGTDFWASISTHPMVGDNGEPAGTLAMVSDHAGQRTLASFAHEVNNPLAAVLSAIELAGQDLELAADEGTSSPWLGQALDDIGVAREAALRLREVVAGVPVPAAPTAAPTAPRDPEPAMPKRRAAVLVVDDEPLVGKMVARVLADHDVTVTASAQAALQVLASGHRFDLVLCDLMMPEVTGMDLHAELMRADPQTAGAMVFLTGGAFTPRATAFLAAIPNPHIEKPFNPQALRQLAAQRGH
jgi:PAS domain S-box-containing protein